MFTDLDEITVWSQRNRSSLRHVLGKIKKGISFMMLADLNEIVGAGVCKQVHPLLWIPCAGSEVLDKIIVDKILAIRLQVIVINIRWVAGSLVQPPPVPKDLLAFYQQRDFGKAYHSA